MKRYWLVVLVMAVTCMVTSCGDYSEVEDLAVVVGMSMDETSNHHLRVTCDIMRSSESGSDSTSANQNQDMLVTGEGLSMASALENIQKKLDKRIYLSHNTLVVLSDKVISDRFASMLDELERNRELRLNQMLVVVRGDADQIWTISNRSETPLAITIRQAIQNWEACTDAFRAEQFRMLRDWNAPYGVAHLPWLDPQAANWVAGLAFVDPRGGIAWWSICPPRDNGALWLLGDTRNLVQKIVFQDPFRGKEGQVCIRWVHTHTSLGFRYHKNKLCVTVNWWGNGYIEAMSPGHVADQTTFKVLEDQAGRDIQRDIHQCITRMRSADVNLWRMSLYRTAPQLFRILERKDPSWWKTCDVSYVIHPHIVHSGLSTRSPG
ncbi:Ger(x)C family spore germination C-terminal domain-containing protein [Alicyclobacillus mali (ex Roth et al. 2021)]|uniref:Ger(x)C family spore germination protein n=1 Tax=Alicyclobacillus mali (ex Roth et al. 2021) TaxID=1123961 RepID=UPI001A8ECACF|nr:Ger(x)C family spore germination C-terminal domain-containing protein [Alicyclobacillus mali (ex Roth et al. 2021)]